MSKTKILGGLALLLAAGTGCTSSQSKDIATDALYASMSVTADGSGQSVATAALQVGGPTSTDFLDLSPGDTLVATEDGTDPQTMTREDLLGAVFYQSTFGIDSAGTLFQIAFDRTATSSMPNPVSAPDSHVSMPAPFDMTVVSSAGSFSRASDPIDITWTGSGQSDPMSYQVYGSCINTTGQNISDTGSVAIPAGTIQAQNGQGADNCQITITLSRSRSGTVDPAYGKGGAITASQSRTVQVLSTP